LSGSARVRLALLAGLAVLAAAPTPATAIEPNIYVAPSFWHATLSGDGQTGSGGSDRRFDVDNTLGLDPSTTVRSLESFLRFDVSSVLFGFQHGSYNGSNKISRDLTYKHRFFPAGSRIRSNLDYNHTKLLYGRPFLNGSILSAGVRIGLYEYRIGSEVSQSGNGSSTVNVHSTIPVVGASLTINPTPAVRIYGEILTSRMDRGGVDSKVRDAYVAIDYLLFGRTFALQGGYRYSQIKANDKGSAQFDLNEKGTFVGFVVRF